MIRKFSLIKIITLSFALMTLSLMLFSQNKSITIVDTIKIHPTRSVEIVNGENQSNSARAYVQDYGAVFTIGTGEHISVTLVSQNPDLRNLADIVAITQYPGGYYTEILISGQFGLGEKWISNKFTAPDSIKIGVELYRMDSEGNYHYLPPSRFTVKHIEPVGENKYTVSFPEDDEVVILVEINQCPEPFANVSQPQNGEMFYISRSYQPIITGEVLNVFPSEGDEKPTIGWIPTWGTIETGIHYREVAATQDSVKDSLTVLAVSPCGYYRKTIYVWIKGGNEIDHFEIPPAPDTIEYQQKSRVTAIAKDSLDQELVPGVDIPYDTPLTITAEPDSFGHFAMEAMPSRIVSGGVTGKGNAGKLQSYKDTNGVTFFHNKENTLNKKSIASRSKHIAKPALKTGTKGKTTNAQSTTDAPPDTFKCTIDDTYYVDFIADGVLPEHDQIVIITVRSKLDTSTKGIDTIVIKGQPTILLGESKYYYAVEKDGKLTIKDTTAPVFPDVEGIVKDSNLWVGDPVAVAAVEENVETIAGTKLGVYWETKKPKADSTGTLPDGMLRLVGRYWTADSVYKVKLTAKKGELIDTVIIEVKKPDSLGSKHNIEKNVKGVDYDFNEIVIRYAGKYGIPPQFIKADIQKESKNFNPSYRWEPFYDAWYLQLNRRKRGISTYMTSTFQYKIDSSGNEGTLAIPTDHTNLYDGVGKISSYPGYVGTIWEEFYQYCTVVNPNAVKNLYPQRNNNGDTIWHTTPVIKWNEKFDGIKKKLASKKNLSEIEKNNIARDSANYWLRYQWQDGIMNTGIAQTRSASSYGLLQIMYPTAHKERSYIIDDNHLPEYLNETDTIFNYAVPFILQKIDTELVASSNKLNNWDRGFEQTYIRAFNRYNGASKNKDIAIRGYGFDVIRFSGKYLPKKK